MSSIFDRNISLQGSSATPPAHCCLRVTGALSARRIGTPQSVESVGRHNSALEVPVPGEAEADDPHGSGVHRAPAIE